MEWPKLKNIIILILLLANLFLLVMVVVQEGGSARYQEQALINAMQVLEKNGISVNRSVIPDELELSAMVVERDQTSEQELATSLLGACNTTDLGGGRYSYESPLGSAEFRNNGNFNIAFLGGIQKPGQTQDKEQHALELLEQAGLTCVSTEVQEQGGDATITLLQTWEGMPVYSCQITLEYRDGSLQSIFGQRLMGVPQSALGETEVISVPTALLRILNGINDLNDICNEIISMRPGYLLTTSAQENRMTPMWYVQTDTGTYSLNGLTGELERAQYGARVALAREEV